MKEKQHTNSLLLRLTSMPFTPGASQWHLLTAASVRNVYLLRQWGKSTANITDSTTTLGGRIGTKEIV